MFREDYNYIKVLFVADPITIKMPDIALTCEGESANRNVELRKSGENFNKILATARICRQAIRDITIDRLPIKLN